MESEIICSRKFGKNRVEIRKNGSISITGDWFTNWGLIYPHMISIFKTGKKNPITGFRHQVIGMNSIPSMTHTDWIYSKIEKGYFDHLIED